MSAVLIFTAFCGAFGQSAAPLRVFDVASVKPHTGPVPSSGGHISTSGSRLTVDAYSMLGLIMYAYSVKNYQISNAAALDHTMYDIVAEAGDGRSRTKEEFRPMVQALLADRFKLRVHREMRETPVYALVIGKNGPKLKESAPDAPSTRQGAYAGGRSVELTWQKATMEKFADFLGANDGLDRIVIDKTGLTGTYDIKMTYVPQNRMSRGPDSDPGEISVFTAVEVQLGLRLEPLKAIVEILVVDHSERPSEN